MNIIDKRSDKKSPQYKVGDVVEYDGKIGMIIQERGRSVLVADLSNGQTISPLCGDLDNLIKIRSNLFGNVLAATLTITTENNFER
jgi:hypothetical protein